MADQTYRAKELKRILDDIDAQAQQAPQTQTISNLPMVEKSVADANQQIADREQRAIELLGGPATIPTYWERYGEPAWQATQDVVWRTPKRYWGAQLRDLLR